MLLPFTTLITVTVLILKVKQFNGPSELLYVYFAFRQKDKTTTVRKQVIQKENQKKLSLYLRGYIEGYLHIPQTSFVTYKIKQHCSKANRALKLVQKVSHLTTKSQICSGIKMLL